MPHKYWSSNVSLYDNMIKNHNRALCKLSLSMLAFAWKCFKNRWCLDAKLYVHRLIRASA